MDPKGGRWVRFRIRDVHLPDPAILLNALHGDDLLMGRVIAVSDTGRPDGTFAVVEVSAVDKPVIVPTRYLTSTQA